MRKRIFIEVSILLMIICCLTAYAAAEARIDSVSFSPSYIEPGNEVDVYVKFHEAPVKRSILTTTITNGTKQAIGEDPDVYYIAKLVPADELGRKYLTIKEGSKNVGHVFTGESWTTPFKVKVSENAVATSYKLTFQLIYATESGTEGSIARAYDFNLPVKGVVKFKLDSESELGIGSQGKVTLMLTNVGGGNARHVSVTMNASSPFTVLESSEAYLGDFTGSESGNASFGVSVLSSAENGAHSLPVTIKYIDSSGVEQTIKKEVGVLVEGKPEVSVKLEEADALSPGSTGTVTVTIVNEGLVDAKFLSIKLLPNSDYTVSSVNDVYVGSLSSDDFESEEFEVVIKKDVTADEIPLYLQVNYKAKNSDKIETLNETLKLKISSTTGDATGGTLSTVFSVLFGLVGLVVLYLVLWFTLKIVGVVTGKLDEKIFKRKRV